MDEIIYCDGPYEVHPMQEPGLWAVVNSSTGNVRSTHNRRAEAIEIATELNADPLLCGPKVGPDGKIANGGVLDGMTPAEVLADREAYRRACGE